jgi:hypothetical protein
MMRLEEGEVMVVLREARFCWSGDRASEVPGALLMTAEHHQQSTTLIAGVTTRGGHVVEADRIGKHRRLICLARKLGEIVPTDAAQRVRAVKPADSTGEAGSTRRDQVPFDKDPMSSDVVMVVVSDTRLHARVALRFGISGGAIRVRFDKGVDRLIFGAYKGTKEG